VDNLGFVSSVFRWLPPLKRRKNPSLALVIGFATGGLGLAIFFWSIVDLFIPLAIVVILGAVIGAYGVIGGAIVAALYGYARAATSNERLAAQSAIASAEVEPDKLPSGDRRSIHLSDLIEAKVLVPDTRLFAERGAHRYEATVTSNGELELPSHGLASSPSGAAQLASGRRTNGWNFWKVQTNTGVVSLSALRNELIKMRTAAGAS
jgi:hypothetical protein